MLTELPARLNGALDELLGDDDQVGAREVEAWRSTTTPRVEGLGEGFWTWLRCCASWISGIQRSKTR